MKRTARSGHVIEWNGKPVKNLKTALKQAIRRPGADKAFLGAHAFRHPAAAWIADGDQDLRMVQLLPGHGNIASTQV